MHAQCNTIQPSNVRSLMAKFEMRVEPANARVQVQNALKMLTRIDSATLVLDLNSHLESSERLLCDGPPT